MRSAPPSLLILVFDIGSSSSRSALFDEQARLVPQTAAHVPYSVRYGFGGGAELSPFILRRAAERCRAETLRLHRDSRSLRKTPIVAVASSSLWHALLGLDRHSR